MAVGRVMGCGSLMDLFLLELAVGRSSMAIKIGLEMPEEVATRSARNCWAVDNLIWQLPEVGEIAEKFAVACGMDKKDSGSLKPEPCNTNIPLEDGEA